MHDGRPMIAGIGRGIDLASGGAEVDAAGIERVNGHRIAEHVNVAILLREAVGEGFPLVAAGATPIDAELTIEREMLAIALNGDDVDGFGFVGVDVDDETEVSGKVAAYFMPGISSVVGA